MVGACTRFFPDDLLVAAVDFDGVVCGRTHQFAILRIREMPATDPVRFLDFVPLFVVHVQPHAHDVALVHRGILEPHVDELARNADEAGQVQTRLDEVMKPTLGEMAVSANVKLIVQLDVWAVQAHRGRWRRNQISADADNRKQLGQ